MSSGGQYTEKLEVDDLEAEKMRKFDGTVQYARDKRRQVGALNGACRQCCNGLGHGWASGEAAGAGRSPSLHLLLVPPALGLCRFGQASVQATTGAPCPYSVFAHGAHVRPAPDPLLSEPYNVLTGM